MQRGDGHGHSDAKKLGLLDAIQKEKWREMQRKARLQKEQESKFLRGMGASISQSQKRPLQPEDFFPIPDRFEKSLQKLDKSDPEQPVSLINENYIRQQQSESQPIDWDD